MVYCCQCQINDSVNKRTKEISESMKLHILGVWQMPMKFIRQLANSL